jgi:hypothetical protein
VAEFKDKIGAAAGNVEFLYDPPTGRIDTKISGSSPGFFAMYIVAISMDGRHLLAEVAATGIGVTPVYPQPSVVVYIQSDQQGMWGRNCPMCQKYFRTNHVMGLTSCPYCGFAESGLTFVSKEQRAYITACYDGFMRARMGKKSTAVEIADIPDQGPAWHYAEVKQQYHFKCETKDCKAETDILGEYGYCPRCARTNARKLFNEKIEKMLNRIAEKKKAFPGSTPSERKARSEVWEELVKESLSKFEALGKHLRNKLLLFPMTSKRRKRLEDMNFQTPVPTNKDLLEWFDIGLFEWPGDANIPQRSMPESDLPFIKEMIQKRHILMHNGGLVDEDYLKYSGDKGVILGERISISSKEAKRFIECVRTMGLNFMDNLEFGFKES